MNSMKKNSNITTQNNLNYSITGKTPNYTADELGFEISNDGNTITFNKNVVMNNDVVMNKNVSMDTNKTLKFFPKGTIIMWRGRPENIPKGWALCDGQNGTPELRGRFVLGYGWPSDPKNKKNSWWAYGKETGYGDTEWFGFNDESYTVGQTGGSNYHALSHSEMPSHNHKFYLDTTTSGYQDVHAWYGALHKPSGYSAGYDYDWGRSGDFYGPRRGWDTENTGHGHRHNNMPPYYVLIYIMKL